MTIVETLVPVIVAVGSAGGGIALIVKSLRRRGAATDRESPVPQERPVDRARCVTHAELAAALSAHRAEFNARLDEAEDDCERRTAETARNNAEQFRELAAQARETGGKVERALGILEGFRDGMAPSRRGR